MPPRLPTGRLSRPQHCHCLRTRPDAETRPFHISTRTLADPAPSANNEAGGNRSNRRRPQDVAERRRGTRLRRDMYAWLAGPGKAFRNPLPGSSNYMSAYDKEGNLTRTRYQDDSTKTAVDQFEGLTEEEIEAKEIEAGIDEQTRATNAEARATRRAQTDEHTAREGRPKERPQDLKPYPLNPSFQSQPVLSEELRDHLYRLVVEDGLDPESVAEAYQVDIHRVAAVVRLRTMEKQWVEEGKQLAKPYARAVMNMLPQTPFSPKAVVPHESINDLPVHPKTRQQIFYPTSESRQFTREDAAKAFADNLLPADKRIPLPRLVQSEKLKLEGKTWNARKKILLEDIEKEAAAKAERERKHKAWEERTQRVVTSRRWDFKFQDISAEKVGKDGRSQDAVGHRYGMPHEDRKRGLIKIPTSVE